MLRDEPIGDTDTDEDEEDDKDENWLTSSFVLFVSLVCAVLCSQEVNLNELKHGLESNSARNKPSSLDFCVISLLFPLD